MPFRLFEGTGAVRAIDLDKRLPAIDRASQRAAAHYIADEGLRQAVDVAVYLGMPLLLTGEPGTGKTQLAWRVAEEFNLGEPFVFETKSSSVAQDLFYTFDAIKRFALAQVRSAVRDGAGAVDESALDPRRFIRYQALGLAILLTNEGEVAERWLPPDHGLLAHRPRRSVVLIDEIDKAPRDFPNDLLNEIDRRRFRVPEVGDGHVEARQELAPIVIITSNSEKQLPDAFLRRCVYHHIEPPSDAKLQEIVALRLPHFLPNQLLLTDAIKFFQSIREDGAGLTKKPSTAELLNWLDAMLGHEIDTSRPLKSQYSIASRSLQTLAKTEGDRKIVLARLAEHCGVHPAPH